MKLSRLLSHYLPLSPTHGPLGMDLQQTFWVRSDALPADLLPFAEFASAALDSAEAVQREADRVRSFRSPSFFYSGASSGDVRWGSMSACGSF